MNINPKVDETFKKNGENIFLLEQSNNLLSLCE